MVSKNLFPSQSYVQRVLIVLKHFCSLNYCYLLRCIEIVFCSRKNFPALKTQMCVFLDLSYMKLFPFLQIWPDCMRYLLLLVGDLIKLHKEDCNFKYFYIYSCVNKHSLHSTAATQNYFDWSIFFFLFIFIWYTFFLRKKISQLRLEYI